ncbi:MAG: class I SAM-dependent RNA methyltransferase, partial [Burkholderiales bacterium]|nr:class I SAM-dependent RNA methyltransferase [Burkholderiales bacterium]
MERFFATCPRGLEGVLGGELQSLSASRVEPVDGGVGFSGPYALCRTVNLHSRIASRVLWRIGEARYRSEIDIFNAAKRIRWAQWFGPLQTIRVDTAAIKSELRSLDIVTLRVKDAVCDVLREAAGSRPDVDTRNPDVRIHVFLTRDEA